MLAAGFALGYALHFAVEKPLRRADFWSRSTQRRIFGATATYLASVCVATSAWATHGWDWRVPEIVRNIATSGPDLREERARAMRSFRNPAFPTPGAHNVLILSDSHGRDALSALHQNGNANVKRIQIRYSCQPTLGPWPIEQGRHTHVVTSAAAAADCEKSIRQTLSSPLLKEVSTVIVSARWKAWAVELLPAFVAALRQSTNAPIVILGPTVEFKLDVPKIVEQFGSVAGADGFAVRYEDLDRRKLNRHLKTMAADLGVLYVDKFAVLCNDETCPIFIPDTDILTIFDYGHWTAKGAAYFGGLYKTKLPEIAPLLFGQDTQDVSSRVNRNGG